jgi:hypothetical protein
MEPSVQPAHSMVRWLNFAEEYAMHVASLASLIISTAA